MKMQNYIWYPINLANVPIEIKKTFNLDDSLVDNYIIKKDNNEKLVEITKNDNILISPFWEDEEKFEIKDKELKEIIELEWKLLKNYVEKNDFGIYVRESVYYRLKEVNNYLKLNWYQISIKIWYRPLEVQHKLFDDILKYIKNKFPELNYDTHYQIICDYVSDPNNFTPPHSTWGAVDIQLLDTNLNPVDMWSPLNYPWEQSNITFTKLEKHQIKNRWFLQDTMLMFGFANLATEWWHFSYGDPKWAYFYGYSESLYNKI